MARRWVHAPQGSRSDAFGHDDQRGRMNLLTPVQPADCGQPGSGVAWVLNHRSDVVEVLRSNAGASWTNVAFGSPGRKTLCCTESVSGSVLRSPMEHAGLPLHGASFEPGQRATGDTT